MTRNQSLNSCHMALSPLGTILELLEINSEIQNKNVGQVRFVWDKRNVGFDIWETFSQQDTHTT